MLEQHPTLFEQRPTLFEQQKVMLEQPVALSYWAGASPILNFNLDF